jgi:hypothetical protein
MLFVYLYNASPTPQQFGRTEMVLNCLNPRFSKKFKIDYFFETLQKLKFCVYDIDNDTYDLGDDDFLGELECTLGQVSPLSHNLATLDTCIQRDLHDTDECCMLSAYS